MCAALPNAALGTCTKWPGYFNLQGHVHDGGHSSRRGGPGGRPEALPRGAAWLVHMNVAVYDSWHHHAVPHIQHLQSHPQRQACGGKSRGTKTLRGIFNLTDRGEQPPTYLSANILSKVAAREYLVDLTIFNYYDSWTHFIAKQHSVAPDSTNR